MTQLYSTISSLADDALLEKYAPEMPPTTYQELFWNSEMWLVNMENMCLDAPRVYAPHFQFIGRTLVSCHRLYDQQKGTTGTGVLFGWLYSWLLVVGRTVVNCHYRT